MVAGQLFGIGLTREEKTEETRERHMIYRFAGKGAVAVKDMQERSRDARRCHPLADHVHYPTACFSFPTCAHTISHLTARYVGKLGSNTLGNAYDDRAYECMITLGKFGHPRVVHQRVLDAPRKGVGSHV
jgi:hypothetical protein